MKKLLFIITCVIITSHAVYSQSLKGTVFDTEDIPLIAATVQVISSRDSLFIAGSITDNNGTYLFSHLTPGAYWLTVSYMGKQTEKKKVMLFKDHVSCVDFKMEEMTKTLNEVKVVASGVVVKGDTTTYFTKTYTTGQERTLKDVLEVLPGIKVDPAARTITARGKPVRRILMEDQDLFQGNNSVPLEHLPADVIKNVEVIDNYSDYNLFAGFRTSNETVINLKINDKMKGKLTGSSEILGGLLNKYQTKNSSMYIGKKIMASAMLSGNNTGHAIFDFKDIISMNGGFNELLSNESPAESFERTLQSYSSFLDDRQNIHRRDNGLMGFNLVWNPSKPFKLLWNGMVGIDSYKLNSEDELSYVDGMGHIDYRRETMHKNHYLSHIKCSYSPNSNFNIIYKGALFYNCLNQKHDNIIESNSFQGKNANSDYKFENNILAVGKFGENVLGMSLDIDVCNFNRRYRLNSDTIYQYMEAIPLSDHYLYKTSRHENRLSAQMFYIHRWSDRFYSRVGIQYGNMVKEMKRHLFQKMENSLFDADNKGNYDEASVNLRFGKDKGKLKYTFGGNIRYHHLSSNSKRDIAKKGNLYMSPYIEFSYQFNTMHSLILKYDEFVKWHPFDNLAESHSIENYNQIIHSTIHRMDGYSRKASLLHVLMLPFKGITWTNLVAYESMKNSIINNYQQKGMMSVIERQIYGPNTESWSAMTSFEKKLMAIPINFNVNLGYFYNDTPMSYNKSIIKNGLHSLKARAKISTYYTKGFNGKLVVESNHMRNTNDRNPAKMQSWDCLAGLTFNTQRIFMSLDLRNRTFMVNDTHNSSFYTDFSIRYKLGSKTTLYLSGNDIFHLKNRKQTEVIIHDYYTNNRSVMYMPGSLLCGISFVY